MENTPNFSEEFYALVRQKDLNDANRRILKETDWKVIRELERLYLSGTNLNLEREKLREEIQEVDWNSLG